MLFGSVSFAQGHFRWYKVTCIFAYNAFQNEIKRCGCSHFAQLVKTHRLMCNCMPSCRSFSVDHHLNLWSRDLRSIFDPDLSVSKHACLNVHVLIRSKVIYMAFEAGLTSEVISYLTSSNWYQHLHLVWPIRSFFREAAARLGGQMPSELTRQFQPSLKLTR